MEHISRPLFPDHGIKDLPSLSGDFLRRGTFRIALFNIGVPESLTRIFTQGGGKEPPHPDRRSQREQRLPPPVKTGKEDLVQTIEHKPLGPASRACHDLYPVRVKTLILDKGEGFLSRVNSQMRRNSAQKNLYLFIAAIAFSTKALNSFLS